MTDKTIPHFSDFAKDEAGLSGDKMKIADVLNREICVTAYRLIASKVQGKQCLQLQFKLDNHLYVTFTNSTVLIRQAQTYEDHMPFLATIIKRGSYYTFSS